MTLRSVLKWAPVGFALQMLLIILVDSFVGLPDLSETGYGPWIAIGESFLPSAPVGFAMSPGAIVGLLLGMFAYSAVVATVLCLIRQPRYE